MDCVLFKVPCLVSLQFTYVPFIFMSLIHYVPSPQYGARQPCISMHIVLSVTVHVTNEILKQMINSMQVTFLFLFHARYIGV